MTDNKKKITQAAIFGLVLVIIFHLLTVLVKPKWYSDEIWEPVTQIHDGFYALEKDTTDVFFIGSSQVFADINPLLLWHDFGIASYDLTSSAQRLWISKYYIQETIKRQHPKVIVLEMGLAFEDTPNDEDRNRKALDYMRLSPEKLQAITATLQASPEEPFSSYLFPLFRYHARWSSLDQNDFQYFNATRHFSLRGFSPRYHVVPASPEAWKENASQSGGILPEKNKQYLDEIVNICKAEGVALILFRSPTTRQSMAEHNSVSEYAKRNHLVFLDFNLLTAEIGLLDTDFNDANHLNINGANKVSSYFGNYLASHYDLRDWRANEQWAEDYKNFLEYDAENRLENHLEE